MTKEEKEYEAKEYAKINSVDYEDGSSYTEVKTAFVCGYEAAESDNEQMMCKFAEWIIQENHIFESGGLKYTAKTMPELLNLFKESLKQ